MPKAAFRWNPQALYEIRSSAAGIIDQHLSNICDRANAMTSGTFEWESHQGSRSPQGRWRGTVYPADYRARRDNATDNILVKALGGG